MSEAIIRCKVRVTDTLCGRDELGAVTTQIVKLRAVYGADENKEWSRTSPQADFTVHIGNPELINKLTKGSEFYIDLIPVEKPGGAA